MPRSSHKYFAKVTSHGLIRKFRKLKRRKGILWEYNNDGDAIKEAFFKIYKAVLAKVAIKRGKINLLSLFLNKKKKKIGPDCA